MNSPVNMANYRPQTASSARDKIDYGANKFYKKPQVSENKFQRVYRLKVGELSGERKN
jgi:hypothetical protein